MTKDSEIRGKSADIAERAQKIKKKQASAKVDKQQKASIRKSGQGKKQGVCNSRQATRVSDRKSGQAGKIKMSAKMDKQKKSINKSRQQKQGVHKSG